MENNKQDALFFCLSGVSLKSDNHQKKKKKEYRTLTTGTVLMHLVNVLTSREKEVHFIKLKKKVKTVSNCFYQFTLCKRLTEEHR